MKEEVRRIMKLVQEGKLSPDDAAELVDAFSGPDEDDEAEEAAEPQAEAKAEPGKSEKPFASILSSIEKITKDVSQNINWKDIAEQVKDGVVKGADAVRAAAEDSGMSFGSIFGSQAVKKVQLPVAVPEGKKLIIHSHAGKLKVQGGAALGSMDLSLTFRGGSQEEAQAKADAYHPVIEETDQSVILRIQERSESRISGTVYVPAGVEIEAHQDTGSLSVLDTAAPCHLRTASASVELRGVKGALNANLATGDIRLVESKGVTAMIETKSGDIQVRDVEGSLTLRTSSGDIQIKEVDSQSMTFETASGDISGSLSQPVTGSLQARTVSGDIRLEAPEGSSAVVSMSTLQGAVSCGLELDDLISEEMKITGRLGAGEGRIDLSAVNGDLALNLKGAELKNESAAAD